MQQQESKDDLHNSFCQLYPSRCWRAASCRAPSAISLGNDPLVTFISNNPSI